MNFLVEDVLKTFSPREEIEFLYDIQFFKGSQIAVNAGTVDTRHFFIHEIIKIFKHQMAIFIVQNELKQESSGRSDAHLMRAKNGEQVSMFFHW